MDLHLRGQTAIVTGASRGTGLAIIGGLVGEVRSRCAVSAAMRTPAVFHV